ncbi:Por secretion system C-terminal sorting domain-containing protein [Hymenobacter daecheongensis DSM 21074]|uniref:Por secretion system C-terminal sorting domain-containing protein n=1 Tax=Hymenobacter daecheongensis DSM 21074 TaxID=1121955 RepID=A0A1M6EGY6_9BACT|nr:heparinase II/III family protein [Hymenobacter daecheongensis]SHI84725.1 Por secretion system C-terminal sorting domain-containing protein [Hymenobacter daecheongensis DSM 21074]
MNNFTQILGSILFALTFACQATAQTGSWTPPGADPAYPRTLLKQAATPGVRLSLAEPEGYAVYADLYASTLSTPTTDNTSAGGRRGRATFAKNAAFVALLDRQADAGMLSALPAARRTALIDQTRALLETINPAVEVFATFSNASSYTEWQWRSKELIDYLIAYDLLRGAGETDATLAAGRAKLQTFAANLYKQSVTPFFGFAFYTSVKNNHTLMTAAALGMAAVVLNDAGGSLPEQQPQNWINTGLYNLDNVLWEDARRQSDPAAVAGYAEGPYYFKYAFLNCLPFFRALGNFLPDNTASYTFGSTTRAIRHPYHDPRYEQLYDWITAILMPDGRFPSLEDSYIDMGMPELALTGKSRYVKSLHLENLAPNQLGSLTLQLRDVTVDMRAAYLAALPTPTSPTNAPLTVLPRSGNLIFRSGNDEKARYLHVYGKSGPAQTNSGGHSQADATSFILHAHGQLLALDPGYLSFSRRGEIGNATNHNMLLVDGTGPAIGTPGAANDTEAAIQKTFQTAHLAYGEVQTTYAGQATAITRKTLFIRNTYFLMADFVKANATHTYTWQLHGYGLEDTTATSGSFRDSLLTKQQGTWRKNGASLTAHVTATGGATAYEKATNIHEATFNTTENHTTMLVRKSGETQTQFLAALYPFTSRRVTLATASTATTAALTARSPDYHDVAFAQADTVLSNSGTVSADGLVNFYSTKADGRFAQAFVELGTGLSAGGVPVLQASKRATISWQKTDATHYAGYVSRGTTLVVALAETPQAVTGTGVSSFSYDAAARQLRIVFGQASDLQVTTGGGVLPVVLTKFNASRQPGSVLLTWQTASELQNQGFAVQRRTAAEADFRTIDFVAGAGSSQHGHTYSHSDFTAPAGLLYYRLQQLDANGTTAYSPVVAVAALTPLHRLTVAPVPARQHLQITFADPQQQVQLRLLNQTGQTVLQQAFQLNIRLNISYLQPGLYYLQALDADGNPLAKTEKVLIAP